MNVNAGLELVLQSYLISLWKQRCLPRFDNTSYLLPTPFIIVFFVCVRVGHLTFTLGTSGVLGEANQDILIYCLRQIISNVLRIDLPSKRVYVCIAFSC